MAKHNEHVSLLGSWAFLIGVVLAVILGFVSLDPELSRWMAFALVIIGIIVGLLNVTAKEARGFMHAGAILVIVTWAASEGQVGTGFHLLGEWAPRILDSLMLVFVPATIIVSLRAVFGLAKM